MTSKCFAIRENTPVMLNDNDLRCSCLSSEVFWGGFSSRSLSLYLLFFCALITFSLHSQAQQTLRVITDVSKFTSIDIAKRINLTLVMPQDIESLPTEVSTKLMRSNKAVAQMAQGGAVCVVKAEPTVAKKVRCEVGDGSLSIYADRFQYKSIPKIDVFLVCDSTLRSIHGTSSSNVFSRGLLRLPSLDVVADYAMSVTLSLISESVTVKAKDRSQVTLLGNIGSVRANLINNSSLDLTRLTYGRQSVTVDESSLFLDGK